MLFRWFLIGCATFVSACGLQTCAGLHQTAISISGFHVQWWLMLTAVIFGFCCIKVKK